MLKEYFNYCLRQMFVIGYFAGYGDRGSEIKELFYLKHDPQYVSMDTIKKIKEDIAYYKSDKAKDMERDEMCDIALEIIDKYVNGDNK